MDNKCKAKLGFRSTNRTIRRVILHFTEEEKHQIIQEWQRRGCTKQEIWEKYTGKETEHGEITRWMRQLGYDSPPIKRRRNLKPTKSRIMKENNASEENIPTDFETLQLKNRIAELEAKLEEAEMKAIAFSTMVEIAEKEFNIPIRKKYNTKPLKK